MGVVVFIRLSLSKQLIGLAQSEVDRLAEG